MKLRTATALLVTTAAIGAGALEAEGSESGAMCHGEPATFVGGDGDDRLTGGEVEFGRDPVIVLGGGNDRLLLAYEDPTGHVTVCAGEGRDFVGVLGGSGARAYTIDGGPGPDTIGNDEHSSDARIELGPMTLIGGEDEDRLFGSLFGDRLVGGSGEDLVLALDGSDRVAGGEGEDTLYGHGGDDRMLGGDGDDAIDGMGGRDRVDGGGDVDSCTGEEERGCER